MEADSDGQGAQMHAQVQRCIFENELNVWQTVYAQMHVQAQCI
jgi:hypothetical protein